MLTAIRVPAADKDTRIGFAELARRHGDYAIVGLAACARANGKGLADVRLAYFGVGATPCGRRNPKPRSPAATSRPPSPRSTSIRPTTCRRPAR